MEVAGLLKEATTDRDAIAHFVWGQDKLMDKGEDEMEEIINQMEEEWEASKANYGNVEDYLEELENEGGMEMFMEGRKAARLNEARSNIMTSWKTGADVSDTVMADMEDFLEMIYKEGNYDTMDDIKATFKVLSKLADDYLKEMR